jgi:hypothetical protein
VAKEIGPDNSDSTLPTVAADAFVQEIMMLRKTFIQDSVLMMELHSCLGNIQSSLIQSTFHSKAKSKS